MITIQKINTYFLKIPLTTPWKISYSTETDCETVIIEIVAENSLKGFGEASPFAQVTGDTPQSILAVIEMLEPQLIGKNPLELRTLIDHIDCSLAYNTAAKAGIDMALHDLTARYYQVPLKTLLGGAVPRQGGDVPDSLDGVGRGDSQTSGVSLTARSAGDQIKNRIGCAA